MVSRCDPATDSATMADALVGGGTGTGGKEVGVLMELEHQPATVASRRAWRRNGSVMRTTCEGLLGCKRDGEAAVVIHTYKHANWQTLIRQC